MKIGIVGAGIAGTTLAVMLKKSNPELDVTLIDVNNVVGKKYSRTGNGRCNLGNRAISREAYNSYETRSIVSSFPIDDQIAFYNSIGIEVYEINNWYYPYSLSANCLVEYLNSYLNERKIKKVLECSVNDYTYLKNGQILLRGNKRDMTLDKVIFASGGISGIAPNVVRHNIHALLKKHGHEVSKLKPGLTPITTNEQTRKIEDIRVKCKLSVINTSNKLEKIKYEELGEVLFKNNGISGICVMNASSIIQRESNDNELSEYLISLDLMPDFDEEALIYKLERYNEISSTNCCLYGIFNYKIADYILDRAEINSSSNFNKFEIKKLAKVIKNLKFTVKNFYGFQSSQVTIGGVEYSDINLKNLQSKINPNVYIIGELLNSDGLCGGYNIMFAVASAYRVYLDIIKKV